MENGVKNNDGSLSNECTNNELDENGNLKWVMIVVDEVSLYLLFLSLVSSSFSFDYCLYTDNS